MENSNYGQMMTLRIEISTWTFVVVLKEKGFEILSKNISREYLLYIHMNFTPAFSPKVAHWNNTALQDISLSYENIIPVTCRVLYRWSDSTNLKKERKQEQEIQSTQPTCNLFTESKTKQFQLEEIMRF